jgi:hypothetical protein
LGTLRANLRQQAATPDQDIVVAEVAQAEVAAAAGNSSKVRGHLAKVGKWALGAATAIGAGVAAAAIKAAAGL